MERCNFSGWSVLGSWSFNMLWSLVDSIRSQEATDNRIDEDEKGLWKFYQLIQWLGLGLEFQVTVNSKF
jgi:hypothetical protein